MNIVMISIAMLIGLALLGSMAARRSQRPRVAIKAAVGGFLGVNMLSLLALAAMVVVGLSSPMPVLAQSEAASGGLSGAALGAALATGLACIGAGIAVGIAGAAAIGGITEKPEILGRTLIFVGLAEGIAIYGLIISFMILNA